jgi:hypothetical protein
VAVRVDRGPELAADPLGATTRTGENGRGVSGGVDHYRLLGTRPHADRLTRFRREDSGTWRRLAHGPSVPRPGWLPAPVYARSHPGGEGPDAAGQKLTRTSSSVTLETAAANLFAGSRRIAPRLLTGVLPPLRDTTWLLEGIHGKGSARVHGR